MNAKRVEHPWRREEFNVPQKQPKKQRLWLHDGPLQRPGQNTVGAARPGRGRPRRPRARHPGPARYRHDLHGCCIPQTGGRQTLPTGQIRIGWCKGGEAMSRTFVIGGARSGKSAHAKCLAESIAKERVFIATAEPIDLEMRERIARHQVDRDRSWLTVEEPVELLDAIAAHASCERSVLVDCLTLWLSNLTYHRRDVAKATAALVTGLASANGHVILISNEVGLGLVPDNPVGRAFRDAQGRLNQDVAAVCERVYFMTAGLPLLLKG